MFKIKDYAISTNIANVSENNELYTINPSYVNASGNPQNTGNYFTRVCEQDAGLVDGTPKQLQTDCSAFYRKKVSKTTLLHSIKFGNNMRNSAVACLTNQWNSTVFTEVIEQVQGVVIMNAGLSVTNNSVSVIQSYKTFNTLYNPHPIELEIMLKYVAPTVAINIEVIIGFVTSSTANSTSARAIPTSGIYFKYTAHGELVGIINYNSVEYSTSSFPIPTVEVDHIYKIIICNDVADFIIDNIYYDSLQVPSSISINQIRNKICVRHSIFNVPSCPVLLNLYYANVSIVDMNCGKPWSHVLSSLGYHISTVPIESLATIGSSALNYTNSLAVGAGVALTNATNSGTASFGGQTSVLPTLQAGTDGILTSWLPGATFFDSALLTSTSKNFIIQAVWLQGCVTTSLTGGPVIYILTIGFNASNATLATTSDGASSSSYKKIPIGIDNAYPATAAVGTLGKRFYLKLDPPVSCASNFTCAIIARNIGTVTTLGAITYLYGFDGYWE